MLITTTVTLMDVHVVNRQEMQPINMLDQWFDIVVRIKKINQIQKIIAESLHSQRCYLKLVRRKH